MSVAVKKASLGGIVSSIRKLKSGNIIVVFVILQVVAVIFGLIFPDKFRYLSTQNLTVLFKSIPTIAVVAMGVNLLMISGEFDLSVGAVFTFCSLIMAKAFNAGIPLILTVFIALTIGGFIGFINGLIVTKLELPSFIITLGSMYIWRGMIFLISQGRSEAFETGSRIFDFIFSGNIWIFQNQLIWMLLICFFSFYILEINKIGNHMFAVGGNIKAAKALGINVNKTKIIAFIITGVLAAFAGILSMARVETISPVQGEGLELQVIAACVIGGTSLMGGRGSVLGAALGSAFLFIIQDVLLLLRVPGFYFKLFLGVLIIIAVIINKIASIKEN